MGRIAERSPDLVRLDEDGSGRGVQPEIARGRLHESPNAPKHIAILGPQRPEPAGLEDREAALAGHPEMILPLMDGKHVADVESIRGQVRAYLSILPNRDASPRESEPDAPPGAGHHDHRGPPPGVGQFRHARPRATGEPE